MAAKWRLQIAAVTFLTEQLGTETGSETTNPSAESAYLHHDG
jgi:hypothetical protein